MDSTANKKQEVAMGRPKDDMTKLVESSQKKIVELLWKVYAYHKARPTHVNGWLKDINECLYKLRIYNVPKGLVHTNNVDRYYLMEMLVNAPFGTESDLITKSGYWRRYGYPMVKIEESDVNKLQLLATRYVDLILYKFGKLEIHPAELHNQQGVLEKSESPMVRSVIEKDKSPFLESEICALNRVNEQLRALSVEMKDEALRQMQLLEVRVADSADPVDDYCIVVEVQYVLSEDDAEYREDGDNILTSREYVFDRRNAKLWENDFGHEEIGKDLGVKNHCRLFYDLYDFGYGHGQQRISLRDILRIGDVLVDVVVRNQMYRKLGW